MATLHILVEGHTEERVIKQFLSDYWKERFEDCIVIYSGSGNGGLIKNYSSEAKMVFQDFKHDVVLVLIDLYEEPTGLYDSNEMTHDEGFQRLKERLESSMSEIYRNRFGGFPVVMEIETWLLADEEVCKRLGVRPFPAPESIEHPVSILKQVDLQYEKGGEHCQKLFSIAKAKRIYESATCPHFNQLIDWLITPPSKSYQPDSIETKRVNRQKN